MDTTWNRSLGTSKREQGVVTPKRPKNVKSRFSSVKREAKLISQLKGLLKRRRMSPA